MGDSILIANRHILKCDVPRFGTVIDSRNNVAVNVNHEYSKNEVFQAVRLLQANSKCYKDLS